MQSTAKDWWMAGSALLFTAVILASIGHYLAHMMVMPF
jgi:hypothetical protein